MAAEFKPFAEAQNAPIPMDSTVVGDTFAAQDVLDTYLSNGLNAEHIATRDRPIAFYTGEQNRRLKDHLQQSISTIRSATNQGRRFGAASQYDGAGSADTAPFSMDDMVHQLFSAQARVVESAMPRGGPDEEKSRDSGEEAGAQWFDIDRHAVQDIYMHMTNHTDINACIDTITREMTMRGMQFFHNGRPLLEMYQRTLQIQYTAFARDLVRSACEVGLVLVSTAAHRTAVQIPIVLHHTTNRVQFRIGRNDQMMYRVMRGEEWQKDVFVLEFFRPLPDGTLTSPIAKLMPHVRSYQNLTSIYMTAAASRARPPEVYEQKDTDDRKREKERESLAAKAREDTVDLTDAARDRFGDAIFAVGSERSRRQQQLAMLQKTLNKFHGEMSDAEFMRLQSKISQSFDQPIVATGEQPDTGRPYSVLANGLTLRAAPSADVPPLYMEIGDRLRQTISDVFGIPREYWTDAGARYKGDSQFMYSKLYRTISFWAQQVERYCNLMLLYVYGPSLSALEIKALYVDYVRTKTAIAEGDRRSAEYVQTIEDQLRTNKLMQTYVDTWIDTSEEELLKSHDGGEGVRGVRFAPRLEKTSSVDKKEAHEDKSRKSRANTDSLDDVDEVDKSKESKKSRSSESPKKDSSEDDKSGEDYEPKSKTKEVETERRSASKENRTKRTSSKDDVTEREKAPRTSKKDKSEKIKDKYENEDEDEEKDKDKDKDKDKGKDKDKDEREDEDKPMESKTSSSKQKRKRGSQNVSGGSKSDGEASEKTQKRRKSEVSRASVHITAPYDQTPLNPAEARAASRRAAIARRKAREEEKIGMHASGVDPSFRLSQHHAKGEAAWADIVGRLGAPENLKKQTELANEPSNMSMHVRFNSWYETHLRLQDMLMQAEIMNSSAAGKTLLQSLMMQDGGLFDPRATPGERGVSAENGAPGWMFLGDMVGHTDKLAYGFVGDRGRPSSLPQTGGSGQSAVEEILAARKRRQAHEQRAISQRERGMLAETDEVTRRAYNTYLATAAHGEGVSEAYGVGFNDGAASEYLQRGKLSVAVLKQRQEQQRRAAESQQAAQTEPEPIVI